MAFQRLTDDQVRKLTTEQRIKYLRQLEEARKQEAEEAQRKAQEDIEAAERLIHESEEEEEEEEELLEKETAKAKPEEEEESLEDRIAKERAQSAEETGQYRTDSLYESPGQRENRAAEPNPLYRTLEDAARGLDSLYNKRDWDSDDERLYREAKERVERASTYQLQSDKLKEELGVAQDFLNRLHYRT